VPEADASDEDLTISELVEQATLANWTYKFNPWTQLRDNTKYREFTILSWA
jgi:hypothetical protein